MTTLETIDIAELGAVTGGLTALQKNVCNRGQFDQMVAQMVPDSGPRTKRQPGFERHVVASVAKICHYDMPK